MWDTECLFFNFEYISDLIIRLLTFTVALDQQGLLHLALFDLKLFLVHLGLLA